MTHRHIFAAIALLCGLLLSGAALAQDGAGGQPCTKDSVVLTHCNQQLPNNGLPVPAAEQKANLQKEELQHDLDNQRAKSTAAATANPDDEGLLSPAQVTGRREKALNPSEVFDKDLGTASGTTTQTSDSMGNKTECINKCIGPACCKTTVANPGTPGVVP